MVELKLYQVTEQAFEALKRKYTQKNGTGSFTDLMEKKIKNILVEEIKNLKLPNEPKKWDLDDEVLNQFRTANEIREIFDGGKK
ncbi:MAG TPA: hypothetical protein PLZ43_15995 [bacterium]|nr:hypothetical protein [bacterium]